MFFAFLLLSISHSSLPAITVTSHSFPITLEHAVTQEQLSFGLMNRSYLPENHGMTFNYPSKRILSCWMFNCHIDLSLAFLDENHIIQEIFELKAYPEKMDPKRVVNTPNDLSLYPYQDPIRHFFLSKTVTSSKPAKFALEMNKDWFTKNGINPNDVILWDVNSNQGLVLKTIEIDPFIKDSNTRIWFNPPSEVSLISSTKTTLILFDEAGQSVTRNLIPSKPLYTKFKVSYALIKKN